jgi:hypothetical protein
MPEVIAVGFDDDETLKGETLITWFNEQGFDFEDDTDRMTNGEQSFICCPMGPYVMLKEDMGAFPEIIFHLLRCLSCPKTTLISLSHENDDGYMEDATEMMLPQFLKVLDDDSNWQGGEEE